MLPPLRHPPPPHLSHGVRRRWQRSALAFAAKSLVMYFSRLFQIQRFSKKRNVFSITEIPPSENPFRTNTGPTLKCQTLDKGTLNSVPTSIWLQRYQVHWTQRSVRQQNIAKILQHRVCSRLLLAVFFFLLGEIIRPAWRKYITSVVMRPTD